MGESFIVSRLKVSRKPMMQRWTYPRAFAVILRTSTLSKKKMKPLPCETNEFPPSFFPGILVFHSDDRSG
jgi:hypothetical protein